jgi:proteasome regulatory subunit
VSMEVISAITEKATGAELQAICREAGMMAVRHEADSIGMADFTAAVKKVKLEKNTDTRMYT